MVQLALNQCEELARLAIAGFGNAAIPSLAAVALAYIVMRLKAWNSVSRYWAWWLVLGFVILLPMAMLVWRPPTSQSSKPAPLAISESGTRESGPSLWNSTLSTQHAPVTRPVASPAPTPLPSAPAVIFILCCGAVCVQVARLALGLFAGARLKRRAAVPQNSALLELFYSRAGLLKIRRRVSIALSSEIAAPVAIGYWTPCILLPDFLIQRLNATEMGQVLSHELAHVSRYDDWMIGIQRLVEALFVYHPLVHFISRRIDLDREMACDDQVISSSQANTYAACLTKIAELAQFGSAMALTVPLLARKSHLAKRVEMMLDRTRAHLPILSARRLLPFAISGVLAAFISLHAPALIAFPVEYGPVQHGPVGYRTDGGVTPSLAAIEATQTPSQPALPAPPPQLPHAPVPPRPPSRTNSDDIESIAVTAEDGSITSFEGNGNERTGHSPLPRGTIVFQRNGKSYVIRDRSTLDAARDLLKPQQELALQQETLGAQQEKLGEAQAKLGEQQAALANRQLDPEAVKNLEKQLHDLESKMRAIDVERAVKTATDAQQRIAELQSRLGDMQSRLGEEQGRIGDAQGKLGEQQGKLGEQQGRLGEQQGKLGEQQEREAKRAEQKLKDLIRRAQSQGLAQPLR